MLVSLAPRQVRGQRPGVREVCPFVLSRRSARGPGPSAAGRGLRLRQVLARQPRVPGGLRSALQQERAREQGHRHREDRAQRPDDERPEQHGHEAERQGDVHGVGDELRLHQHLQHDVDGAVDGDHRERERPPADDERHDRGRDDADDEPDVRDEVGDEREDRPHRGGRDAERPEREPVDDRDDGTERRADHEVAADPDVEGGGPAEHAALRRAELDVGAVVAGGVDGHEDHVGHDDEQRAGDADDGPADARRDPQQLRRLERVGRGASRRPGRGRGRRATWRRRRPRPAGRTGTPARARRTGCRRTPAWRSGRAGSGRRRR